MRGHRISEELVNTKKSQIKYGVKISTIEHLMGALFGLGIDNAIIELNNEEVPILDGSAKDFIHYLRPRRFVTNSQRTQN